MPTLDGRRKGTGCRVIARGTRNSCLVQFVEDGFMAVISRNALRRATPDETAQAVRSEREHSIDDADRRLRTNPIDRRGGESEADFQARLRGNLPAGWLVTREVGTIQVVPNFGRAHDLNESCWCHPRWDKEQPLLLIHECDN